MSQLEPASEDGSDPTRAEPIELTLPGEASTVAVPDDATPTEAAAVAAAVGSHLRDCRQAALASATRESVAHVDDWVLATRLRSQGKRRWPADVERGSEWRAAARSF